MILDAVVKATQPEEELGLRVRHDAVFISSVLFTIAFLFLVPLSWNNAHAGCDEAALERMGQGFCSYLILMGQFGVASLALFAVVLIVIWKGYVNKLRWTWFVMFIIVWGWVFPLLVLPNLVYFRGFDLVEWISWENLRSWMTSLTFGPISSVSIFLLMVTALILPVRSFFREQSDGAR